MNDAAVAAGGVAVDGPTMCHDGHLMVGMAVAALADVNCFGVMTVELDYYDYSDSLQNNVHGHNYQNQIRH